MPFQTVMNAQPAVGIEGDFCSANPRFSQLTNGAPIYAGPNGVTVGRFAWQNGNIYAQPFGGGRIAFIHRDQPSLLVPTGYSNWLPQSSMVVPPGLEVVGYDSCDVWARFAGGAAPGANVYASYLDGTALAAASSVNTATAWGIADPTAMSMTGSIAGTVMTITAATTGHVYPGSIVAGAGGSNGVAVITGTQVVAQITPLLSGEATGGVGRYLLNYDYGVSSVQSSTITGSIDILTITTGGTNWHIGDVLTDASGTALTAGTVITADSTNGTGLTGAGGAGTYAISPGGQGTLGNGGEGNLTGTTSVETNWFVDTYAGTNELAKISRHG